MTLPRNNLSDSGSVRSIDMKWGGTGIRVGHANTRCILAGRRNSRREMQLTSSCQGKLTLSMEIMSQWDPVGVENR